MGRSREGATPGGMGTCILTFDMCEEEERFGVDRIGFAVRRWAGFV
jgi:hypothetical protein